MGDANRIDELRLIGVPGTNKVMAGEFSRLVRRAFSDVRVKDPRKDGLGALAYPFEPRTAELAVHYHRTSSRVLWGLYQSSAQRLEPLYDDLLQAVKGDARPWYRSGATLSVRVANVEAFAAGGRQIVGVVKNAVVDGAAARGADLSVDAEDPDLHLDVRLHDDRLVVSVDLAGRPMNQRGYRSETGKAPLRENLAAVLVMLARHDGRSEVLVDPMAGSGTIAIEAAAMARGLPVWVTPRRPALSRLPLFAPSGEEPRAPLFGDTQPLVLTRELDRGVRASQLRNLASAEVEECVESGLGDFRDLDPEQVFATARRKGYPAERGLILSNPPYGERLDPAELERLYRDLGGWCRRFSGWRAAFLVANPGFEAGFGGRPRIKKPLNNGPLKGYFYLYDL